MSAMRFRRFGRTELAMPVLTLGGMRYQQAWQDLEPGAVPAERQANVEAIVHHAFELGMRHFETARGYGSAEMQLGWVLPSLPREQLIVQTKVHPCADAAQFLSDFEASLRNLRVEYVDLFGVHGVNNREKLDWTLRKGGCLDVALRLKAEGRVRHVGFSTHATTDLIVEAVRNGGFDYVNLHYYFVNLLNWDAVEEAAARDMGVFIISPNDKGGKLYAPPAKLVELCRPLTPMQFNALFCLAHPEVHTLSIGASRPSDLDEHVAALAHYDAISKTIAPILARIGGEMERTLGREWCSAWSEGLPEYLDVPGQVNVKEIARLWTYARGLDLIEWGKMRYNLLGRGDDWFPGENAAKLDREALARALSNSPVADQLIDVLEQAHSLLLAEPSKRLSQS